MPACPRGMAGSSTGCASAPTSFGWRRGAHSAVRRRIGARLRRCRLPATRATVPAAAPAGSAIPDPRPSGTRRGPLAQSARPGHTPPPQHAPGFPMPTREGALVRAASFFDQGGFKDLLARLVAIRSTAQEPGFEAELHRYLEEAIPPWVEGMGFTATIHPNPAAGFGPILTAA